MLTVRSLLFDVPKLEGCFRNFTKGVSKKSLSGQGRVNCGFRTVRLKSEKETLENNESRKGPSGNKARMVLRGLTYG